MPKAKTVALAIVVLTCLYNCRGKGGLITLVNVVVLLDASSLGSSAGSSSALGSGLALVVVHSVLDEIHG